MQIVRTFCVTINTELGRDKYTQTVLKRGKLVHWQKCNDMNQKRNTRAEQKKTYKSHSIEESGGL